MQTTEKLSRSKRRRAQREKAATLKATGAYVRRHRSLYETGEIRDAVQHQLAEQRKMIAALRKPNMDPSWQYDEAAAKAHRDETRLPRV